MTQAASNEFLSHLRSVYPRFPVLRNPWYLVAAVAFSASNRPEAVPPVFHFALQDLKMEQIGSEDPSSEDRLTLARRFRESILQSGLLSGYSRAINSLVALHECMPAELQETGGTLRNTHKHLDEYAQEGRQLFQAMYGDNATNVQNLLDTVCPDMGWFSNTVGYGITYGGTKVLSQTEISLIIATANIAMDTPRQIAWHLKNAQNGGSTLEEVKAAREIAIEVAKNSGIQWKEGVPEIE